MKKKRGILKTLSLLFSIMAANQVCALFAHQDELPSDVKSLRKF